MMPGRTQKRGFYKLISSTTHRYTVIRRRTAIWSDGKDEITFVAHYPSDINGETMVIIRDLMKTPIAVRSISTSGRQTE